MRVRAGCSMLSESTKMAIIAEQNHRMRQSFDLDLESRLENRIFLTTLWEHLHTTEREVIKQFLLHAPQGFLGKRDWDRLMKGASANQVVALTRLRRLGLILTVRKLWSEVGYIMPLEVRVDFLARIDTRQLPEKTTVQESLGTLSYYIPQGRGIHLDMFALFNYLRTHELPLTKRQLLHSRSVARLVPLFTLASEHAEPFLAEIAETVHVPDYPPQLTVILDLAMRLQLVQIDNLHLRLNEAKLAEWLNQPNQVLWDNLYRVIVDYYLPQEPWLELFAFRMHHVPGGKWVAVEWTLAEVAAVGGQLPDDAEAVVTRRWLHLLLGLGFVKLGHSADGMLYWSWQPVQEQAGPFGWYIESGGDVIVPPTVPLTLLWQLASYSELVFEGEMIRCQLSMRKVQHCLANGQSEAAIRTFLDEHCMHPLPEMVADQLQKWAHGAKQIRFESVVCVRTADPRILVELQQLSLLAPYLGEVISPTAFLVRQDKAPGLYQALKQCGYDPQGDLLTAVQRPPIERPDPQRAEQQECVGLFDAKRIFEAYQVENVFPEVTDSLPQLGLLPKMWTQHFQSYHPQTLRELFRRSQELQLQVKMETGTGSLEGIPQTVSVENGYWYVTVEAERKLHKYKMDEIHRARILLPEYLA